MDCGVLAMGRCLRRAFAVLPDDMANTATPRVRRALVRAIRLWNLPAFITARAGVPQSECRLSATVGCAPLERRLRPSAVPTRADGATGSAVSTGGQSPRPPQRQSKRSCLTPAAASLHGGAGTPSASRLREGGAGSSGMSDLRTPHPEPAASAAGRSSGCGALAGKSRSPSSNAS